MTAYRESVKNQVLLIYGCEVFQKSNALLTLAQIASDAFWERLACGVHKRLAPWILRPVSRKPG
ncbi:hypothetical protein EMIT0P44_50080 [Pseudomonas sp. IT-P44]